MQAGIDWKTCTQIIELKIGYHALFERLQDDETDAERKIDFLRKSQVRFIIRAMVNALASRQPKKSAVQSAERFVYLINSLAYSLWLPRKI